MCKIWFIIYDLQNFHYLNNFKIGITCAAISGFVTGGEEKYIDNVNTALECAKLVQMKQSAASGMTWYLKECYAAFGHHIIRGGSRSIACLFKGTNSH